MNCTLFLRLLLLLPAAALAQQIPQQERLAYTAQIQAAAADSARASALLRYGDFLIDHNKDSAIAVLKRAVKLEAPTRRSFTLGKAHLLLGVAYAESGNYPAAKAAYLQAVHHYTKGGHYTELAKTHNNIGNLYNYQGLLEEAVAYYVRALELVDQKNAVLNTGVVYNNLAAGLQKLGQYQKSLYYCLRGEKMARETGDSLSLARLLVVKSAAETNMGKPAAAASSIREAFSISQKIDFVIGKAISMVNLADLYYDRGQFDSSLYFQLRAKPWAEQAGDPYYLNAVYYGLGKNFAALKQHAKAVANLLEARRLAAGLSDKAHLAKIWRTLSDVYAAQGQYRQSLEALQQAGLYADSLQNETVSRQVHSLETRFRTAEKDKTLAQQQLRLVQQSAELKSKNMALVLSVGGLVAVCAILVLLYRNYRQKQRLQAQRLIALQKEKETEALYAMMSGEEKERIRMARELHDGVGSELAAARMQLEHLHTQFPAIANAAPYRDALNLVAGAAIEIRKTAHNLMPEALHQQGLAAAVELFCGKMARSSGVEVAFQCYGTQQRLQDSFALMVYRMVQELLHNALRHAQASQVLVQLSFAPHLLSLTVEDNGIGFDPAVAGTTNGMGLNGLQARVAAFGGRMHIDAAPGKGVAVYIEFDLNQLTQTT